MKKIFSSALFPPVHYFSHLAKADEAFIEIHCNYIRQTYRNRYVIMGANGILPLSVPIIKNSGKKTLTTDVQISYDTGWNNTHWKSIEAAYRSSPYYIYYKDEIAPLFKKRWKYLIDLNLEALKIAMECTDIDVPVKLTARYEPVYQQIADFREMIHPKKKSRQDESFQPIAYRQVFGNNHPFVPNLSILDLIFNKGPESLIVLNKSIAST